MHKLQCSQERSHKIDNPQQSRKPLHDLGLSLLGFTYSNLMPVCSCPLDPGQRGRRQLAGWTGVICLLILKSSVIVFIKIPQWWTRIKTEKPISLQSTSPFAVYWIWRCDKQQRKTVTCRGRNIIFVGPTSFDLWPTSWFFCKNKSSEMKARAARHRVLHLEDPLCTKSVPEEGNKSKPFVLAITTPNNVFPLGLLESSSCGPFWWGNSIRKRWGLLGV